MGDFGSRLKHIRKTKRITQKDLAENIQVAQSTIANYENNIRFPGSEKLRDISDYLEVSVDYLLGLTEIVGIETNGNGKQENIREVYKRLIDLLISSKSEQAKSLIKDLTNQGICPIEIIEEVFIPVLEIIGDKWEKNQMDIGEEHLITELIEKLFAYISESQIVEEKLGLNVVFMAPPGEDHIISLKMATEYFKKRGWNLRFVGRSIPVASLIKIIEKGQVDLLVLSSTMAGSVNSISYIVEAIKSNLGEKSPRILLGGASNKSFKKELIASFADYHIRSLPELTSSIEKIEKEILKTK